MVLSVPGESVREFLITAYSQGLIQTGEYVFLDVELFNFAGTYWGDHSWEQGDNNDTIARMAYESLLRISLVEPSGPLYATWAEEVKERAANVYGFNYDAHGEKVGLTYMTAESTMTRTGRR